MADDQDKDLEERMSRLEADLASKRKSERVVTSQAGQSGYREAVKISSEFVSAIVVGAILGYLVDKFAGTSPWGLAIFLLLGFVAGVLNVLRTAGAVKTQSPFDKAGETPPKQDEDENEKD